MGDLMLEVILRKMMAVDNVEGIGLENLKRALTSLIIIDF
jgi:hypothetical protein